MLIIKTKNKSLNYKGLMHVPTTVAKTPIQQRVGEESGLIYWRGDELIDGRCVGRAGR